MGRGRIIATNYPYSIHVGKLVQDGLLLARLCSVAFGPTSFCLVHDGPPH